MRMKFNRYYWNINQDKQDRGTFRGKLLKGFKLNIFLKSDSGMKLKISSKTFPLSEIKTQNIKEKIKKGWLSKKTVYSTEFKNEILNKNKKLSEIKEIEIIDF